MTNHPNRRQSKRSYGFKPSIFEVPSNASYYVGSGQALAAIENGAIVDAAYYDLPDYFAIKKHLAAKYPAATIIAGMMSCYQFTSFDE